jgi:membrane-bound lytic murein transglycosylase D
MFSAVKAYALSDSTLLAGDTLNEEFVITEDDAVLLQLDQLIAERYGTAFLNQSQGDSLIIDSLINDEQFAERIAELDKLTPFDLTYNKYVDAFIHLYLVKKRDVTQRIMGLTPMYFPLFEEALSNAGLPLELKYLAIVESALNPKARSRAGAMGLWQFMYRTGRMYDLHSNSYYDERMDPIKSTEAACRFLSDLYDMYGDWNLVIAAYNCGPGNVNKAIRRSGGKRDFWEIRAWLPRETRGYVPAFMAVNYVMNYGESHGLVAEMPQTPIVSSDTVMVCGPLSFTTLAEKLEVDLEWLTANNPVYRHGHIPEGKKLMTLCLPTEKIGLFLTNEDSLYALHYKKTAKETEQPSAVAQRQGEEVIHRVRSGEVLGTIAQRYRCSVSQLREWNNLYGSRIYPGQRLTIYTNYTPPAVVKKEVAPQPKPVVDVNGKYKYHVVQPGDTLWDIAKKYEEVTVNDLKRLNSNLNFKRLKPGDKIKVSKVS